MARRPPASIRSPRRRAASGRRSASTPARNSARIHASRTDAAMSCAWNSGRYPSAVLHRTSVHVRAASESPPKYGPAASSVGNGSGHDRSHAAVFAGIAAISRDASLDHNQAAYQSGCRAAVEISIEATHRLADEHDRFTSQRIDRRDRRRARTRRARSRRRRRRRSHRVRAGRAQRRENHGQPFRRGPPFRRTPGKPVKQQHVRTAAPVVEMTESACADVQSRRERTSCRSLKTRREWDSNPRAP